MDMMQDFLIPEGGLENTPSRKDGISEEMETNLRIYGCQLIQQAGVLLRLPQVVMATGQVLFHRFYYRVSLRRHDVKCAAMGAIFLACKSEEVPKKIRDICNVFHRLHQRNEGVSNVQMLDIGGKQYWKMKADIIHTERHILKQLGFIIHVVHPHKFVLNYLKILDASKELTQTAWNFANDSLRTNVCVRFHPEVIATSCIYLAARCLQCSLPEKPKPWWELFDTTWQDIAVIGRLIMELYSRQPVHYEAVKNPKYSNDTFAEDEEEEEEKVATPKATNVDQTPPASETARRKDTKSSDDKKRRDPKNDEKEERKERRSADRHHRSRERESHDRSKERSHRDRSRDDRKSGHYSPQRSSRHRDKDRRRSPY